jgi:ABC-type lipoprotein export system ATPase subunit
MRPAVVLADEPTGSLDSVSGAAVMELLGRLNRSGQTIVVVTHDVKIAALAERVIALRDGAVIREDHVKAARR